MNGLRQIVGSRGAIVAGTVLIVVLMCLVPPWSETKITRVEPYVEYRELATYAPYCAPPPNLGNQHCMNISYRVLLVQIAVVGLAGAILSYGVDGAIAVILPTTGMLVGGWIPYYLFVPKNVQQGWVFPIHILLMGGMALIGAVMGVIAAVIAIRLRRELRRP